MTPWFDSWIGNFVLEIERKIYFCILNRIWDRRIKRTVDRVSGEGNEDGMAMMHIRVNDLGMCVRGAEVY